MNTNRRVAGRRHLRRAIRQAYALTVHILLLRTKIFEEQGRGLGDGVSIPAPP